jgi:hypothetical protein
MHFQHRIRRYALPSCSEFHPFQQNSSIQGFMNNRSQTYISNTEGTGIPHCSYFQYFQQNSNIQYNSIQQIYIFTEIVKSRWQYLGLSGTAKHILTISTYNVSMLGPPRIASNMQQTFQFPQELTEIIFTTIPNNPILQCAGEITDEGNSLHFITMT